MQTRVVLKSGLRSALFASLRVMTVLAVLLGAGVTGKGFLLKGQEIARADAVTPVIVHYHRFAGDYGPMDTTTGWNLWLWPYKPTQGNGAAYPFDGTDAFGEVAHAQVPGTNTQVGVIVRLGDWKDKDVQQDRFADTPGGKGEFWLIQGDPTIYYSASDAQTALAEASKTKPVTAFLDGLKTAAIKLTHPLDLSTAGATDFAVTDTETGQTIAVTGTTDLSGSATARTDIVQLALAAEPDITHALTVRYQTFQPVKLMPRLVLNDPKYRYAGNDLGAVYSPDSTTFRLWAPLASDVNLVTYTDESGAGESITRMTRSDNGTWFVKMNGDLKNRYYLYQVDNFGHTGTAVDPYARMMAVNGKYAQVVDLKSTDPSGWASDTYRKTGPQTNASIYEVHVRDFSIDPNSGMKNRGKYLAFTETGTTGPGGVRTGVDGLKQLGMTHVELLPTQGCATLDEVQGGSTNPAPEGDGSRYNWCYDPQNYNVPNGAYATDPHGTARITEFKQMVQALHRRGIGVILDVVYNHTHSPTVFDSIVPGYYYRQDYAGNVFDFAGPNIASERPMVHRFILDSVMYWAREYHVDGFRFDAMSILGKNLMSDISTSVHRLNPSAVILGEPWSLLPANWQTTYGKVDDQELTKGVQRGMHIGVFNDDIRNALEGDVFHEDQPGYATGDPTKQVAVMKQVVGNIKYSEVIQGFAQKPEEAVNYVSVHDNLTLWDRIGKDSAARNADEATRIKMDELAMGIIFTSQGVPYFQGGDEMLRTKQGNDNSYVSGDTINQFDWSRKASYPQVFAYDAGLIHLRASHPAFRMDNASMIVKHLRFLASPNNSLAFEIRGHANHDPWTNIVVAYNPNPASVTVKLSRGRWSIAARSGKAGTARLGRVATRVSVPGYSMEVLYQ